MIPENVIDKKLYKKTKMIADNALRIRCLNSFFIVYIYYKIVFYFFNLNTFIFLI